MKKQNKARKYNILTETSGHTVRDFLKYKEWQTRPELMESMRAGGYYITERNMRKAIENFNKHYDGAKFNEYIVHGPQGYKVTKSKHEIKKSIADNERKAYTMLKQTSHVRKVLGMENQLTLNFDEEGK